jgi:hypothetical protein
MDDTEMTSMYLSGSTKHYVDDAGRYVTYWRFGYSDAKIAAHVKTFDLTLDVENHRHEVSFITNQIAYDNDGNLILDENGKHTTKPVKYQVKSFVIELEPIPNE